MAVCNVCGSTVPFYNVTGGTCSSCVHDRERARSQAASGPQMAIGDEDLSGILLSTEGSPDLKIARRIDIISAEFAVGMGLLTDVFTAWRDVFGGRSKSYQNALKDARKAVLTELRREAFLVGADAVLGVSLDYSEISGGGKSMLFLVASGTAVKLAAPQ